MTPAFITAAIASAQAPGKGSPPSSLLTYIDAQPDPVLALGDMDAANTLFAEAHRAFPFLQHAWRTGYAISAADQYALTSLLHWLTETVQSWKPADDTRNVKLVAILVCAQLCDRNGGFWPSLPPTVSTSPEWTNALARLIGSFAVTYNHWGSSQPPIWEQEAVEQLKRAEAEGSWSSIADAWHPFESQVWPTVIHLQSVRCLNRYGLLATACTNVRQMAVAMQIGAALDDAARLSLGLASDNPLIQFASLYRTMSTKEPLGANVEQLATQLLIRIGGDDARWADCMRVFNAFPSRYPALQSPLGQALAQLPTASSEAYVKSLVLYPTPVGHPIPARDCVASCLRSFRQRADATRRRELWTAAYERWRAWDFVKDDPSAHLFAINLSPLDYGVVGYLCECMNTAGHTAEIESITNQLRSIDNQWHASLTDAYTEWYRLLSRLQPFSYAEIACPNSTEDWLSPFTKASTLDPTAEPLLVAKYSIAERGTSSAPLTSKQDDLS